MHPGIFGERRDRTALFFRIKFYNLPVNPVICVIDGKASCIFAQTAQPFRFSTQLIKFAAQPCSCQVFFLNDNRGIFSHQCHCIMILMILRYVGRRNQNRRFSRRFQRAFLSLPRSRSRRAPIEWIEERFGRDLTARQPFLRRLK